MSLKLVNIKNWPVQPENQKPAWSNQLMTGQGFFFYSYHFSHNDMSAQETNYAHKYTKPLIQRYKAKYA